MHIAQHWRMNAERYQMQAQIDSNGNITFPPRPQVQHRTETRFVFMADVAEEETVVLQQQAEVM